MYFDIAAELDILDQKPGLFGILRQRASQRRAAMRRLAEKAVLRDAGFVIRYINDADAEVASCAVRTLARLLDGIDDPEDWRGLYGAFKWQIMEPEAVRGWPSKFSDDTALCLLMAATQNHSGYVREAALEGLRLYPPEKPLACVLIRLNDWVDEVAAAARETLAIWMDDIDVDMVIRHHALIDALGRAGRNDLGAMRDRFLDILRAPAKRDVVLDKMRRLPLRERLFCWRALEPVLDDALLDRALSDGLAEIREWAGRRIPEDDKWRDRAAKLLNDTAVRVRWAVLRDMDDDRLAGFTDILHALVFDDATPVRVYARRCLEKQGETGFADRYRDALKNDPAPGVIAGLSETGDEGDIPRIRAYLEHDHARMRAAACAALIRLGAKDADDICLRLLRDPSSKPRKTCVAHLAPKAKRYAEKIRPLLDDADPAVAATALRLLSAQPGFPSLRDIFYVLAECEDAALRRYAWMRLDRWYVKYHARLWMSPDPRDYLETMRHYESVLKSKRAVPAQAETAWREMPDILKELGRVMEEKIREVQ